MNYYERHIGDYLKDTAHLSLLEHGIYTRLLDVYYTREGAIPESEAARLIGARSKDEREALKAVLSEFFKLVDGACVQDRADREIARFKDKQAKAKKSAEARWGAQQPQCEGNANASQTHDAQAMRTHSEGNATRARPQSPVTSNQNKTPLSPLPGESSDPPQQPEPKPKRQRKAKAASTLEAWLADLKAKGEKALPPSDPIFDYAKDSRLPTEFLRFAWVAFRERNTGADKTQADWRAAFRNAVRGNWLRLWWLNTETDTYELTTAGHQIRIAVDARTATEPEAA